MVEPRRMLLPPPMYARMGGAFFMARASGAVSISLYVREVSNTVLTGVLSTRPSYPLTQKFTPAPVFREQLLPAGTDRQTDRRRPPRREGRTQRLTSVPRLTPHRATTTASPHRPPTSSSHEAAVPAYLLAPTRISPIATPMRAVTPMRSRLSPPPVSPRIAEVRVAEDDAWQREYFRDFVPRW